MDFDRLDTILKERGISRRKLALAVGILPGTMSTAFSRRSGLSSSDVLKIAKYLGVNPLYLEGLDDMIEVEDDDQQKMDYGAMYDAIQNSPQFHFALEHSDTVRLTQILLSYGLLNNAGRYEALKLVTRLTYVPEYRDMENEDKGDDLFDHQKIMKLLKEVHSMSIKKGEEEDVQG